MSIDIFSTTFLDAFSRALLRAVISLLRDLGFPVKVGPFDLTTLLKSDTSIDERLGKIDQARDSLTEALSAIDDLGRQAAEQKTELQALTLAVASATNKHVEERERLETLKALASLETTTIRTALDVPTRLQRWAERAIAFFVGVLASLFAAYLWELWQRS